VASKKKRKMSANAIRAALRSPKTPENLKIGLRKYAKKHGIKL
jgi:hypothetical protein